MCLCCCDSARRWEMGDKSHSISMGIEPETRSFKGCRVRIVCNLRPVEYDLRGRHAIASSITCESIGE